jgi:hypothetical protein
MWTPSIKLIKISFIVSEIKYRDGRTVKHYLYFLQGLGGIKAVSLNLLLSRFGLFQISDYTL